MKALINIDLTNDFVTGSLPVGEPAIKTLERNIELTEEFVNNGDYVAFMIDAHKKDDPYHPETKLYPEHNIIGTVGQLLYSKLQDTFKQYEGLDHVEWKDKTRYSAFRGTDLLLKLRERDIKEIHLVGVTTDICVMHTAFDAFYEHFKVVIHVDAVASFDPVGHIFALKHFQNQLGFTLMENGEEVRIKDDGTFEKIK